VSGYAGIAGEQDLLAAGQAAGLETHVVGDAMAARGLLEAFREGDRVGRDI